ncbi:site-specific integrase [Mesorhizobium sp. M0317]|uniref:tyrosine-type recombinase/integrase n=1 Tax=Mesorhizobium sp. M0317 TaxID=2956935 RepID=UPI00333CF336
MPLKLVRRKKSPFLILRGTIRGIRIAEEFRVKREAEVYQQSLYGRAVSKTFAEAALSYLEEGGSGRFLDKPLGHFATTPLGKIGLAEIEAGAKKHYAKASPATRDRQFFTPSCAVLKHAAKRGWCAMPIISRPKKPDGVVRWLTLNEADRLIISCGRALRPLVIFLIYTGARIGEALWLDWKNVDLERAHVSFPKTKNGESRGVPLHPRVINALENIKHQKGCVFRRPDGEPYAPLRSFSDTSAGTRIGTAFRAALTRSKIANFRVHDCRHTWATWHYAANRDLGALMRLGGWKSEKMVMRYAHVNVSELSHTIDRLPGGLLGDDFNAKAKKA